MKNHTNKLNIIFISTNCHSQGSGYKAWKAIEKIIQRQKYGKLLHPILKKEIFIFM